MSHTALRLLSAVRARPTLAIRASTLQTRHFSSNNDTHNDSAPRLSHVDDDGRARMVDVGDKAGTRRTATAFAEVTLGSAAYAALTTNGSTLRSAKGDVFSLAQTAGILAAKQTPSLIPLCHSVSLSSVDVTLQLHAVRTSVHIEATARTNPDARTGVEMEALTAATVAALTVYDMCKAAGHGITIQNVHLLRKRGGKSGDYDAPNRAQSRTSNDNKAR